MPEAGTHAGLGDDLSRTVCCSSGTIPRATRRARGEIPRIEGASDEWTDWHWYTTVVNTNCREIIDNVVDMAHFFYVHGSMPTHFKNIFEGHVATQYMSMSAVPTSARAPTLLGAPVCRLLLGAVFHDRRPDLPLRRHSRLFC